MRKFSKLLAATLILTTVASPVQASSTAYSDLDNAASWAQSAIVKAKELGLMTGDPNGNFRPLDTITRQEAAAILVKLLKLDTTGITAASFADVETSDWGFKQIEAVKRAGLMVGDNNQFRPNDNMTREELALTLIKAQGIDSTGKGANLTFADKDAISGWAKDAVAATVEARLMSGDGTNFNPQQPAMRQEVAVVVVNFSSAAVPQAAVIEKVANGTVSIGGVTYTAADSVKGLFAEGNQAILSNAKIKFNAQDNKITSVTYLEITASGQAAETGKPEFSGNLVLDGGAVVIDGTMEISGNFISLKNVTINGDLEIGKELQNDFYSDKVTVKGKTIVNGGDSNTVVFNNARLGEMSVNKPNVRVQPSGSTTVGDMTVNADATIDAGPGVTIPRLTVGEGAGTVHLNANITGLMVNGSQPMTLGGTGSIGQMTVTNPNARLTLQDGLRFNGITLPSGATPSGIIANYEQIKSHLPTIKIGDQTLPAPGSNTGGGDYVPTPSPAVPTELAQDVQFTDTDEDRGQISGTITWEAASSESKITQYAVYFLNASNQRIGEAIGTVDKGKEYSIKLPENTPLPQGATNIGVFSKTVADLSTTAAKITIFDAPVSMTPPPEAFMPYNYQRGADEVVAFMLPENTMIKIYDAEMDGHVIGQYFSALPPDSDAILKQPTLGRFMQWARIPVEHGFGNLSTLYVSLTQPDKAESRRVAVNILPNPTPPARDAIQVSTYTNHDAEIHLDNVPAGTGVALYDSLDSRTPLGVVWNQTEAGATTLDFEAADLHNIYVSYLSTQQSERPMFVPGSIAESSRVEVAVPAPQGEYPETTIPATDAVFPEHIMLMNFYTGEDFVNVSVPEHWTVKVYNENGDFLDSQESTLADPNNPESGWVALKFPDGFGNLPGVYVTVTEPGKMESERVWKAVSPVSDAPSAESVSITYDSTTQRHTVKVDHVPAKSMVYVWSKADGGYVLGLDRNRGNTESSLTLDSLYLTGMSEVFVSLDVNDSESERIAVTVPPIVQQPTEQDLQQAIDAIHAKILVNSASDTLAALQATNAQLTGIVAAYAEAYQSELFAKFYDKTSKLTHDEIQQVILSVNLKEPKLASVYQSVQMGTSAQVLAALKAAVLELRNIQDAYADAYQQRLFQSQNDLGRRLSVNEIQKEIDTVNLEQQILAINTAIDAGDATNTLAALKAVGTTVIPDVRDEHAAAYQTALANTRVNLGVALNQFNIQNIITQVNQQQAIAAINATLGGTDANATLTALKNADANLHGVIDAKASLYWEALSTATSNGTFELIQTQIQTQIDTINAQ